MSDMSQDDVVLDEDGVRLVEMSEAELHAMDTGQISGDAYARAGAYKRLAKGMALLATE